LPIICDNYGKFTLVILIKLPVYNPCGIGDVILVTKPGKAFIYKLG
jgi:hypothetical protein